MPNYLFAYHGGQSTVSPEEEMALWMAWFGSMGDAVVDGGNPVGQSHTVSASGVTDNGGANPISGYTVVRAETLEAAIAMAQECPIVTKESGSIEVAPIVEM